MFYPFNTQYIMKITPVDGLATTLGNSIGWEETGWLPNDRKVKYFDAILDNDICAPNKGRICSL